MGKKMTSSIKRKLRKVFDTFIAKYLYNGKFVLFVTIICIIVMSIVFVQWLYISSKDMHDKIIGATQQTLKQMEINICATMEQTEDISNMIFNNSSIQAYLNEEHIYESDISKRHAEYAEYETLKTFFNNINSNKDDVIGIRLYVDNDKQYSHEHDLFFSREDLERETWYGDVEQANGRSIWVSSQLNDGVTISCVRMLKSMSVYNKVIGALALDLPQKKIMNILADIDENNVYLIDEDGSIIASHDMSAGGTELLKSEDMLTINRSSSGWQKYKINGIDECIIYQNVDGTNWKLAVVMPWESISSHRIAMNSVSMITIVVILIIVLTILIVSNWFSYSIRKKIRELAVRIQTENSEDNVQKYSNDIGKLQSGIDDMILQINNTMRKYQEAKDKENEAHMKALQAQINPHFLYNVLDAINWMAVKISAEDICFMVDNLAQYFRLSLNKGKNIVTVADELELSRIYLEIQNRRFSNCVTTIYDINEDIYDYLIPKISLQPIIENALIHGIKEKKGYMGHIVISGRIEENYLIIAISDDGVGMSEECLENCMKFASNAEKSYTKSGYGLYNVDERIKLFSKDNTCGISMKSVWGEGTEVTIKVIAKKESNQEEYNEK